MFDTFYRSPRIALLVIVALLAVGSAQAQDSERGRGGPPRDRGAQQPPARQPANPDDAANAARKATGGRVLDVQGADRDGRPGYRVRILQPDGRVLDRHYPGNGKPQD